MPKQNVITGLDVGTTKVACAVGQVKEGMIDIIGFGKAVNLGMRRGMVIDIEEVVSAISACLEEGERTSGVPIPKVIVGIGGAHITSINSKGVIAVSRADGEISDADVERVVEAARAVALPPNREILHIIPKTYTVDGQEKIKDPLGMIGVRLEVESHVIGGGVSAIKNLSKCIYQAGLEIEDMVFGPLATAKALLSKKQKEMGVLLLDIGAGTCGLGVWEEGDVIYCNILPLGSMHLTNDLAIGLRTSLDLAEKIKLKYGNANPDQIKETETIDLSDFDPKEEQKVSRRYVAEIVEARLGEIFSMVKDELKKIERDGMLPAGVVLTGGGAMLEGIVDYAKDFLRLPVQIGRPLIEISGLVDKIDNPIYSEAVGLMLWGLEEGQKRVAKFDLREVKGILEKTKQFFKQFLP